MAKVPALKPSLSPVSVRRLLIQEKYLPKALQTLITLMEGATSEKIRLDAATTMIEHAIGKPVAQTYTETHEKVDATALAAAWREQQQEEDVNPPAPAVVIKPNAEGTYVLASDNAEHI